MPDSLNQFTPEEIAEMKKALDQKKRYLEASRKWRENNKEKIDAYRKTWAKNNREKTRDANRRHYSKLKKLAAAAIAAGITVDE